MSHRFRLQRQRGRVVVRTREERINLTGNVHLGSVEVTPTRS